MKRIICTIIATMGISLGAYAASTGGPSTGSMGSGSTMPNQMNTIQKPSTTPDVNTGTGATTGTGTDTGTGTSNTAPTTSNPGGINPSNGSSGTNNNGTMSPDTDSSTSGGSNQ